MQRGIPTRNIGVSGLMDGGPIASTIAIISSRRLLSTSLRRLLSTSSRQPIVSLLASSQPTRLFSSSQITRDSQEDPLKGKGRNKKKLPKSSSQNKLSIAKRLPVKIAIPNTIPTIQALNDKNQKSLQKISIPSEYPQLLGIPLTHRPLFPLYYKVIVIKDPKVIKAVLALIEMKQPYIGIFLLKEQAEKEGNPLVDVDLIEDIDKVYDVGNFCQITNSYFTGNDENNKVLNCVVFPHRRIKLNKLVKNPMSVNVNVDGEKVEGEVVDEFLPVNQHLKPFNVPLLNVENLKDAKVVDRKKIKAIKQEILTLLRVVSNLSLPARESIIQYSNQAGGDIFIDTSKFADFVACICNGDAAESQAVLEELVLEDRMVKVLTLLRNEKESLDLGSNILKDVDKRIGKKNQEFYLMEQMKSIKKELGIGRGDVKEKILEKFKQLGETIKFPEEAKRVFDEEFMKLQNLEPAASEYNLTRNYLDWITQIPWGERKVENFDVNKAKVILDEDHYGLQDVKDRILEFIAVGKLRNTVEGKIICFVGPPGVGKTSIGKSIAKSLGRDFYRFSVGGLSDVAEIKGHRRTYVGALPGKIIQAFKKVKSENPLIMIDEVDKLGKGYQGDPASALLELLDPEQNHSFLDHYLDIPIDLSKVLFVLTANQIDTIPAPLLDRMEVIRISGYIAEEKLQIAKTYLGPAAEKSCGLTGKGVFITEDAIIDIIRYWCRESGVRNLKKHIEKVYRKAALKIVQLTSGQEDKKEVEGPKVQEEEQNVEATKIVDVVEKEEAISKVVETIEATKIVDVAEKEEANIKVVETTSSKIDADIPITETVTGTTDSIAVPTDAIVPTVIEITPDNLKDYLGSRVFVSERLFEKTPPGVVMGLAWTSMGGSTLYIESILESAITEKSKPSFHKTGQLGDVMKESTTIAYSFAKSFLAKNSPKNTYFAQAALHMHVPEGATPKDGPSAGSTMATSLISLALNKPVKPDVAMTGELTLTGLILKIGGVKEKTIAAKRSGVKTIIFPKGNEMDWEELPDYVKEGLEPHFVEWYDDIYRIVFD